MTAKPPMKPLTMKDLATAPPDPCPLCERPNYAPSDHHLVPRSRGGRVTQTICADCHRAIHAMFDNKELERTYNSVESLLAHEEFAKMVRYIAKQDGRVRVRRRRGRD
jgi:5-methylcytosine-specific restriction endonuclease McrA